MNLPSPEADDVGWRCIMLQDERPTVAPATKSRARERAEMLQGLYIHLFVYVTVNGGLFLINWLTRPDNGGWWARWPAMFWALGLAIHLTTVMIPVFSEDWVDRKERQLERRM